MKPAFFLIYVCFLLLSGGSSVYAPIHHPPIHTAGFHENEQQAKVTACDQHDILIAYAGLIEEEEYLIEEEDENENVHRAIAKKFMAVNNGHLTHLQFVNAGHLCNGTLSRAAYYLSSNKNISHRVLRI